MNREGHLLSTLLEGSQRSRSPCLPLTIIPLVLHAIPFHLSLRPGLSDWAITVSVPLSGCLGPITEREKNGKNKAVLGSWWEYCSEFIKNKEDLIREGFLSSFLPYLESIVSLHHVRPWKRLLGWTRKISHFLAMSSITQLNTQPTAEDEQQQQQQKIGEASKRAQIKMTEIR